MGGGRSKFHRQQQSVALFSASSMHGDSMLHISVRREWVLVVSPRVRTFFKSSETVQDVNGLFYHLRGGLRAAVVWLSSTRMVMTGDTLSKGRIVQGKNVGGISVGDTSSQHPVCVWRSFLVFCCYWAHRRPALIVRQKERGWFWEVTSPNSWT